MPVARSSVALGVLRVVGFFYVFIMNIIVSQIFFCCIFLVRSLNSKIYRLSNLLDKSAKLCMNDLIGIYFKSVRGAHENTAYFIFYEFLKNLFDHNEKFLGWVYIKSSPDGSELPCF